MIPKTLLKRIVEKHALIKKQRPLPASLVEKVRQQFAIEMTYNSNAIEGNKLTLQETFLVINEGITVKGKSLKDHLEAKNHHEAIQFLYELMEKDKRHTVSEHLIRSLQQMIVSESDPEVAGKYRKGAVMISGSKHNPPEAIEVPRLMQNFVDWIKRNTGKLHPMELAAIAHHKITHIHPFVDGNGRTARLLMNLLLMQNGYPLVVILKNDRKKYYAALDKADRGDYSAIEKFIAQAVERSMNIYLKAFKKKESPLGKLVPLSTLAAGSKFSEKYLNLLARSGKLEAHKEGRNWVSSKEALAKYLETRERKRD
jgi:Fic family protein